MTITESRGELSAEDPDSLGGFELVRVIGEGRQGKVYLGVDGRSMPAAIKVLHHARLQEDKDKALRAFDREVEVLSVAPDAFTPRMYKEGWDGETRFLASEFLNGLSLEDRVLDQGPLPPPELRRFAAALCDAVVALHDRAIHHGDIKPRHVIIGPADRLFLIDFGIAQIGSNRLRRRDLFNTAAVILYAAGGRYPYKGSSTLDKLSRVFDGRPDLQPVPEEWRGSLRECLNPDPRRRPDAAVLAKAVSR